MPFFIPAIIGGAKLVMGFYVIPKALGGAFKEVSALIEHGGDQYKENFKARVEELKGNMSAENYKEIKELIGQKEFTQAVKKTLKIFPKMTADEVKNLVADPGHPAGAPAPAGPHTIPLDIVSHLSVSPEGNLTFETLAHGEKPPAVLEKLFATIKDAQLQANPANKTLSLSLEGLNTTQLTELFGEVATNKVLSQVAEAHHVQLVNQNGKNYFLLPLEHAGTTHVVDATAGKSVPRYADSKGGAMGMYVPVEGTLGEMNHTFTSNPNRFASPSGPSEAIKEAAQAAGAGAVGAGVQFAPDPTVNGWKKWGMHTTADGAVHVGSGINGAKITATLEAHPTTAWLTSPEPASRLPGKSWLNPGKVATRVTADAGMIVGGVGVLNTIVYGIKSFFGTDEEKAQNKAVAIGNAENVGIMGSMMIGMKTAIPKLARWLPAITAAGQSFPPTAFATSLLTMGVEEIFTAVDVYKRGGAGWSRLITAPLLNVTEGFVGTFSAVGSQVYRQGAVELIGQIAGEDAKPWDSMAMMAAKTVKSAIPGADGAISHGLSMFGFKPSREAMAQAPRVEVEGAKSVYQHVGDFVAPRVGTPRLAPVALGRV